jgi:hypothetical protein
MLFHKFILRNFNHIGKIIIKSKSWILFKCTTRHFLCDMNGVHHKNIACPCCMFQWRIHYLWTSSMRSQRKCFGINVSNNSLCSFWNLARLKNYIWQPAQCWLSLYFKSFTTFFYMLNASKYNAREKKDNGEIVWEYKTSRNESSLWSEKGL